MILFIQSHNLITLLHHRLFQCDFSKILFFYAMHFCDNIKNSNPLTESQFILFCSNYMSQKTNIENYLKVSEYLKEKFAGKAGDPIPGMLFNIITWR